MSCIALNHVHSIDVFCFIAFSVRASALAARMGKCKTDAIINEWAAHFKVSPAVVRDGWEQYKENDWKHYEKLRDNWHFLHKMHQPFSKMKRVFPNKRSDQLMCPDELAVVRMQMKITKKHIFKMPVIVKD